MLIFIQALDMQPACFPAGLMCITSSFSLGRSSTSWFPYVLVSDFILYGTFASGVIFCFFLEGRL